MPVRQALRSYVVLAALISLVSADLACRKAPPDLDPNLVPLWQANEAILVLGTVQRTAIALNGVTRPDGTNVLSDNNTDHVRNIVGTAVRTIEALPTGWLTTADTALGEILTRLDPDGVVKITPYIDGARTTLAGLRDQQ